MSRSSGALASLLVLGPLLACHARPAGDPSPSPSPSPSSPSPPPATGAPAADAAVAADATAAAIAPPPPDDSPLAPFRRAIAQLPAADRAAFDPVLARFDRVLAAGDPDQQARLAIDALGAFADAALAVAARHGDDFEVQYQVGRSLELLGPQLTDLGGDGGPACARALAFARDLARRFDREARAQAVLAFTAANCDGADEVVLAASARCVNLAADEHCRDLYARTLASYQAPRCDGAAIAPDLAVYAAAAGGAGREATPALTSADLIAIVGSAANGAAPAWAAELTAAGAERLRAATARAAARDGTIVLTRGADVLVTLRVDHAITHASLTLAGVPLDRVCVTTTRRPVPADAQLR